MDETSTHFVDLTLNFSGTSNVNGVPASICMGLINMDESTPAIGRAD